MILWPRSLRDVAVTLVGGLAALVDDWREGRAS